jgi:hypothetical protein
MRDPAVAATPSVSRASLETASYGTKTREKLD